MMKIQVGQIWERWALGRQVQIISINFGMVPGPGREIGWRWVDGAIGIDHYWDADGFQKFHQFVSEA